MRKAALRHQVEDRRPQTRGKGFASRQWRVMTVLTLMSAFGAVAIISGLPMFLFVLYAQLSQQAPTRKKYTSRILCSNVNSGLQIDKSMCRLRVAYLFLKRPTLIAPQFDFWPTRHRLPAKGERRHLAA